MKLSLKGERKAEILIYEDIGDSFWGGVTAKSFSQELNALGDVDEINVRINSTGGDSWDAIAIHNALVRHPAVVSVDVDGIAASAATFIAMAASPGKLRMAENADFMIHRAWSVAVGDKEAMQRMAGRLEDLDETQVKTYAKRSNIDRDKLEAMLDAETWFTAEEAKEIGLIDEITAELKIAASLDLTKFHNTPPRVVQRFQSKGDRKVSKTNDDLQVKIDAAVAEAVQPLKAAHDAAIEKLKADHAAELAAAKVTPKIDPPADAAIAGERSRVHDLHSLATNAGIKDAAVVNRWVEKGLSVTEAKAEIADTVIKQGKLSPNDPPAPVDNSAKAKAQATAEYREHAKLHASLGHPEDKWVETRAKEIEAELAASK